MTTRVLLVDDHAVVRRGLQQILAAALPGAEFGEAGTAAESLALLAARPWSLVLVDLSLPGQDGLALLAEIRLRYPQTRTLVVSAYPEEEFALRCLRHGAAGYVTKASAPEELAAAVKKVLAGGRYVTAALAEKLATVVGGELAGERHELLSNRELQVLRLVATGHSLKQIAAELGLSEKTVATYRSRIAVKLNASTNVELTRYALIHKLVD